MGSAAHCFQNQGVVPSNEVFSICKPLCLRSAGVAGHSGTLCPASAPVGAGMLGGGCRRDKVARQQEVRGLHAGK